jgi:hypothetical protein
MAGGRFGVGALAYLLKNRVYIGEVVYRGDVHRGEHATILDRDLFEAVQAKLAEGAVERKARLRTSPAILTGRIFDDRGNRMSPAHANKRGVRYRYYVSQALLQNRRAEAGSVARVPAPEVEGLVLDGVRKHLASVAEPQAHEVMTDAELIERHVGRVTVRSSALEVCLLSPSQGIGDEEPCPTPVSDPTPPVTLTLPWTAANLVATKGVVYVPSAKPVLTRENRDALLTAISRARQWIEDMRCGRIGSFMEIAQRENRDEPTSAGSRLWPSSHPVSSAPSWTARRPPTSPSRACSRPCPTPGPSRRGGSGLPLAEHAATSSYHFYAVGGAVVRDAHIDKHEAGGRPLLPRKTEPAQLPGQPIGRDSGSLVT